MQEAVDWGKQNIADLTQTATDLKIRFVDQGKQYPAPVTTLRSATFVGAGYPDYPWMFATDGEYTAFASVAVGQFEAIKEHLLALRDISDALNARTGKIAHEVVTDGSVYFGANTDPGNTDESVKFPSAVALVWRWTGDDRFRDSLYDFSDPQPALRHRPRSTTTATAGPRAWATSSARAWARRSSTTPSTTCAASTTWPTWPRPSATARPSAGRAGSPTASRARFDAAWWDAPNRQYADSLENPTNARIQQKHWIGQTPMEAELTSTATPSPAWRRSTTARPRSPSARRPATAASRPTTAACSTRAAAAGPTGAGEQTIFSLNTAIQAVGLGNYGRDASRYTGRQLRADVRARRDAGRAAGDPAVAGLRRPATTTATSTAAGPAARCSCRPGATTAPRGRSCTSSSACGPSLGTGALEVVPQLPPGHTRTEGARSGWATERLDVRAERTGRRYVTSVRTDDLRLRDLRIGATLPRGTKVDSVTLDGRRVRRPIVRETNRGVEVTVRTDGGRHTVVVN